TTPRQEERQAAVEGLEHRIRDCVHRVLTQAGGNNYWRTHIPKQVREKVEKRIAEAIEKHPDIKPEAVEQPRARLDDLDVKDYESVMGKSNWPLFAGVFRREQDFQSYFDSLNEYRKVVMHSRAMTELVRLKGETAMIWFESVLPAEEQAAEVEDDE